MICPYCKGGVRDGAEKCWHCGAELTGYPQAPSTPPPPRPQPPVEQSAAAPEQPLPEPPLEQPLEEQAPDQPPTEQAPDLSLGAQIPDQSPGEITPEQPVEQPMPDMPLEQPAQQAAPVQPGEPQITTLPDDQKQQYVVVEGYTNSDPLDLDHLKYLFFSAEGRINRRRFWIGMIIQNLAFYIVSAICFLITPTLVVLAILFFIYPGIMMNIKRCHDRDRSGHFLWVMFIPLVNLWPAIELGFIRGTPGINRFGPDPL